MLINKKQSAQKGFTLIEMLVIAPIVILAIGAFLTVIISMTGEVIASRAANKLTYDVQDALNRIEQDVQLSATYLATNTVTLTGSEAQGYNDDATNFTNVGGTSGTSLILNMVATTDNPISSTSTYIFLKNQPDTCVDPYDNIPMTYNIVYYVKNDSLWRRVIMPSSYADTTNYACATAWQQPSCSPTYMAAQSGAVFCKTQDVELVKGVSTNGFTVDYYTGSNGSTASTTAVNTSASISDRNNALIPVTTIKASITANQRAGGRDIDHAANIRTTRLATNASAIASLTPPTTPAQPVMTARADPGAKAVFEWPAVTGATGYTFEYNVNGGAWQTGFTNQNTRTYTVTAPANEDVVNARVVAINSAGTSTQATSTITLPLWEPLVLINGWIKYDTTFGTPAYTKTRSGAIILKGVMRRTAAVVAFQAFANLPDGYRPDGRLAFGTTTSANASGRIDVEADGDLLLGAGNAAYISLDTVRFLPASVAKTNATMSAGNGWTNYGVDYSVASSTLTSNGRVFTQGLIVPGTITLDTRMVDISTAHLPASQLVIASRAASWTYIGVHNQAATPSLLAKGSGTSYVSTAANYMEASYASWTNATLLNSWVYFGGSTYSTAQYTKTSDNLVTLKGYIKSGTVTAGTSVLTLPVGSRPKERIMFTTASNGAYARVDIRTDGNVTIEAGGNATWLSLDGITFVGEQ